MPHEDFVSRYGQDCCTSCFTGSIILSEMRRTRTRKPKAKIGRPRKVKTVPRDQELMSDHPDIGLEDVRVDARPTTTSPAA